MKITGWLVAKRPIHIASGTDGNATGIASEQILDNETGRINRVPFVPATVLRGKLRRAASDIAFDAIRERGMTIPLEFFNAMRHGSGSGHLINEPVAPSYFDAQRRNPVMGLFGGGPRQGAGGGMRVAPLYPVCQETVRAELIPPHPAITIENAPAGYMLSAEDTMYPRLDVVREEDPDFDAVIEDKDEAVDRIIAADVARRVGKKSGEETASTVRSSNILTFRKIVAGAVFALDLVVDDRLADHVKGFAIATLARALEQNEIGGMQRIGVGADVFNLASAASSIRLDGEPVFEWDGSALIVSTEGEVGRLHAAWLAWNALADSWTAENIGRATGFEGVDLKADAVRKEPKQAKGKSK